MSKEERRKQLWYFPIQIQMKNMPKDNKRKNMNSKQNEYYREKKKYRQTQLNFQCCRPWGGQCTGETPSNRKSNGHDWIRFVTFWAWLDSNM